MAPTTDHSLSPQRLPQLGTHLSVRHLSALRAELEQQRAFRADQLVQLSHPDDGGPFASSNHEVAMTLLAGARSALHGVQAALWRMDEGTYGLCTVCRDEIDVAALQAVPHTALCLRCQQALPPG